MAGSKDLASAKKQSKLTPAAEAAKRKNKKIVPTKVSEGQKQLPQRQTQAARLPPPAKETILQSLTKDIVGWMNEDIALSFTGTLQIQVNRIPTDVGEGEVIAEDSMIIISRDDVDRVTRHQRKIADNQIIRLTAEGTAMLLQIVGIISPPTKQKKGK